MSYLTLTISHGKRVLPYVRGRRLHDGRLRDSSRFAVCGPTTKTGQNAQLDQSTHSLCGAHRDAADGSRYSFSESFFPHRAPRSREVPGFDSLGLQPSPQCHPAFGVLVLSVCAALSLVPPPRAPSLRTVSAAGLSDLTRFLITRCGAEWCCCLVPLPCCCLVPLPLLFQILGFPFLQHIFSRAASLGSFGGSIRTYFRRYFGGPRQYSRRILRELARYLAANVNSGCCRWWF
eukprot:COSAG05_NODE_92_length_19835_cov_158.918271_4_plen_233_part_00